MRESGVCLLGKNIPGEWNSKRRPGEETDQAGSEESKEASAAELGGGWVRGGGQIRGMGGECRAWRGHCEDLHFCPESGKLVQICV